MPRTITVSEVSALNEQLAPWRIEKAPMPRTSGRGVYFTTQARNVDTGEVIYRAPSGWTLETRGAALDAIETRVEAVRAKCKPVLPPGGSTYVEAQDVHSGYVLAQGTATGEVASVVREEAFVSIMLADGTEHRFSYGYRVLVSSFWPEGFVPDESHDVNRCVDDACPDCAAILTPAAQRELSEQDKEHARTLGYVPPAGTYAHPDVTVCETVSELADDAATSDRGGTMPYQLSYVISCDCEGGTVIAYGPVSGRNVMRAHGVAKNLPGVERASAIPVYSMDTLRIDARYWFEAGS